MGRPKLYHTKAERLLAKQTYSKTYYDKNRPKICIKNKTRYRCKQGQLDVAGLEQELASILGQSLTTFLDHAFEELADSASPEVTIQRLKAALHQVREVHKRAQVIRLEILQVDGVGGKFYRVDRIQTHLKDVIYGLEDVTLQGEIDLDDTLRLHREGELFYQSRPDI
ncbi:hypothetical protein EV363DRAFT_1165697 [Boletus edulis]|nr:hypothetical protein EV363DRAFT_1165697 [Boletus edulis]